MDKAATNSSRRSRRHDHTSFSSWTPKPEKSVPSTAPPAANSPKTHWGDCGWHSGGARLSTAANHSLRAGGAGGGAARLAGNARGARAGPPSPPGCFPRKRFRSILGRDGYGWWRAWRVGAPRAPEIQSCPRTDCETRAALPFGAAERAAGSRRERRGGRLADDDQWTMMDQLFFPPFSPGASRCSPACSCPPKIH